MSYLDPSPPPLNLPRLLPLVAVIPAAGFGTRLRPLTNTLPKEMLPVGRQLALEQIVAEMRAAGITKIVFVLSPAKEALIRGRFGDADSEADLTFAYALQPEMKGLGDAILQAAPHLSPDRPFVVALGDAVFEEPQIGGLTRRLAEATVISEAAVGLAVQRVSREHLSKYGVVRPLSPAAEGDSSFPITDIIEKPSPEEAPSDYAATARYVVSPDVFDVLRETKPGKGGEIQFTDAMRALLAAGRGGVAVPLIPGEARHDLGGLDSYFKAFAAFALRDPEHGESLRAYLKARLAADPPYENPLNSRKEDTQA
ncbi:MAG: NTP transferase domain-containing protein [Cytophagales bacterium]|nr:NTP transferase domain-containing protein [Armatimonadota bacterium]